MSNPIESLIKAIVKQEGPDCPFTQTAEHHLKVNPSALVVQAVIQTLVERQQENLDSYGHIHSRFGGEPESD